jgi:hypothetical protein
MKFTIALLLGAASADQMFTPVSNQFDLMALAQQEEALQL